MNCSEANIPFSVFLTLEGSSEFFRLQVEGMKSHDIWTISTPKGIQKGSLSPECPKPAWIPAKWLEGCVSAGEWALGATRPRWISAGRMRHPATPRAQMSRRRWAPCLLPMSWNRQTWTLSRALRGGREGGAGCSYIWGAITVHMQEAPFMTTFRIESGH